MPIKLHNLSKWELLPEGQALVLDANTHRKIVVRFNTEAPTAFMAEEGGAEYFLGVINGLDTVEFYASGKVTIAPATGGDGAVWFWTGDGEDISHTIEGQRLFVKPMTRDARTPEMDAVLARQAARYERRFALQEANNERLLTQLLEERAAREAATATAEAASMGSGDAGQGEEPDGEGA